MNVSNQSINQSVIKFVFRNVVVDNWKFLPDWFADSRTINGLRHISIEQMRGRIRGITLTLFAKYCLQSVLPRRHVLGQPVVSDVVVCVLNLILLTCYYACSLLYFFASHIKHTLFVIVSMVIHTWWPQIENVRYVTASILSQCW